MSCYSKIVLFDKQIETIKKATAKKLIILHGAVRASKTITQCFMAGEMVCSVPKSNIASRFAVVARDIENCHINIKRNMQAIFAFDESQKDPRNKMAICPDCSNKNSKFHFFGAEFGCVGWSREDLAEKLLGQNIDGCLIDEGVCMSEKLFNIALTRLDRPWAKCIVTTNPGPSRHFLKKNFIDKCDGDLWQHFHFKVHDNPNNSEDYIKHLERSYSGVFYRRYVLGEWCDATGLIYPFFDESYTVPWTESATEYFIGYDHGESANHRTCAILCGYNSLNNHIWVEKEFVTDPLDTDRFGSIVDIMDRFWVWVGDYQPSVIYVDPSHSGSHNMLLHNQRGIPVVHANNDVYLGISTIMRLMKTGLLKIKNDCGNLIEEMYAYCWDEKKGIQEGRDVPLKKNDDCVDAFRYAIASKFAHDIDSMSYGLSEPVKAVHHQNVSPTYLQRISAGQGNVNVFGRGLGRSQFQ